MTTVIDPGTASEVAIFNKGGTAIVNGVCDPASPFNYDIQPVAGRVVALVTKVVSTGTGQATIAPGFEIGDEIWFCGENSSGWNVYDENANLIAGASVGDMKILMKVRNAGAVGDWRVVS